MKPMPIGLHIVGKSRPGKPKLWYVYAWRGGPQIHVAQGQKPKITPAIADAAADARREKQLAPKETLKWLIGKLRGSADYQKLAKPTRANWETWFGRIGDEFGETPLAVLNDPLMKNDIIDWRDKWAATPRAADLALQAFSRVLSEGVSRGLLTQNIVAGISRLYDNDRSEIIWEPEHFEAFAEHASTEVMEGVELAACTGLRRGDLVELPWAAIGEHAIVWKTSKSRRKRTVTVPLIPEAKALFQRIKARHAAVMEAKPEKKRKPLPETVLSNTRWQPWKPGGFGSRFNDAKIASKIEVHLHDLRGTFATRCMIAGLTDDDIAKVLGWSPQEVAEIRAKYVSQARTVIAMGERIAAASVNRV